MSGYCEVGSVNMETKPMMTVRIAITMATIGRRIKNFDMPIFQPPAALKWADFPQRFQSERPALLLSVFVDYL